VKITVNNVMLRSFDADECVYREEEKDVDSYFKAVPFDTESCSFKDYIKISDFDTVKGKNVCYPIADKGESNKNATASHVWFTANRNHGKTSSDPSKIPVGYTLPRLADSKLILPAYKADTSNKGGSGYNSSPKGSGKNSYHGPKDAPKKRTVSVKCKFCGAVMEKVPSGFGRTKQEVECTKCGKKFKAEF
jgi:ribosomal protein S27E